MIDERINSIQQYLEIVRKINSLVILDGFSAQALSDMKNTAKNVCDNIKGEIDTIKGEIDGWN